jgi:hypothetical protein
MRYRVRGKRVVLQAGPTEAEQALGIKVEELEAELERLNEEHATLGIRYETCSQDRTDAEERANELYDRWNRMKATLLKQTKDLSYDVGSHASARDWAAVQQVALQLVWTAGQVSIMDHEEGHAREA